MTARPGARPPGPAPSMKLAAVLDGCEPLGALMRRLHEARAHYETITPLLPPALCADLRPGPVETDTWTVLAANNAAAAKLRQLLPTLLQALRDGGWQGTSIKVRVQPR